MLKYFDSLFPDDEDSTSATRKSHEEFSAVTSISTGLLLTFLTLPCLTWKEQNVFFLFGKSLHASKSVTSTCPSVCRSESRCHHAARRRSGGARAQWMSSVYQQASRSPCRPFVKVKHAGCPVVTTLGGVCTWLRAKCMDGTCGTWWT